MMLKTQLSFAGSGADRRTRTGWQRTPYHGPSQTLDVLSALRRIQPAYLVLAGGLTALVGLTMASWLLVGVGVALVIAAGVTSAARPRTKVMYWRGRRIELTEESSTGKWLRRRLGRS